MTPTAMELLSELTKTDLHEIYRFMREMRGEKHHSVLALDVFISKLPALRAAIQAMQEELAEWRTLHDVVRPNTPAEKGSP